VNASVPFGTQVILPVRPRSLAAHPRMRVDLAEHEGLSGDVVRLMALGGAGLARFGRSYVSADLAAGRLAPVLEPFSPAIADRCRRLTCCA
jgi:DNA-binding transcriptional LysR family regulator